MPDPNLRKELESLREELESITRRVKSEGGGQARAVAEMAAGQAREFVSEIDWQLVGEKLGDHLRDLGSDVRHSKPKALVAAFVAGFIAGKMTSR